MSKLVINFDKEVLDKFFEVTDKQGIKAYSVVVDLVNQYIKEYEENENS